jgi:serine/threonine-protein phosphatase PP1 catalytic subunit
MFAVDCILTRFKEADALDRGTPITVPARDFQSLCERTLELLQAEPTVLDLQAPICVIGDLHGQFYELIRLLTVGGSPPDTSYLFLGGSVNHSANSIETISYLFALKVRYPENIFLLRSSHETPNISHFSRFYEEVMSRYGERELWDLVSEIFLWLPIAAIVANRIFCVHGGLSKELRDLNDLREIARPLEIPAHGLVYDLLCANPGPHHDGYKTSDGAGPDTFGLDVAWQFLDKWDFDLICRGNQIVADGYEFPFCFPAVVTLFSGPNEAGRKGAIMKLDEWLKCSFTKLDYQIPVKAKRRAAKPKTKRQEKPAVWQNHRAASTPRRKESPPRSNGK